MPANEHAGEANWGFCQGVFDLTLRTYTKMGISTSLSTHVLAVRTKLNSLRLFLSTGAHGAGHQYHGHCAACSLRKPTIANPEVPLHFHLYRIGTKFTCKQGLRGLSKHSVYPLKLDDGPSGRLVSGSQSRIGKLLYSYTVQLQHSGVPLPVPCIACGLDIEKSTQLSANFFF